MVREGAAFLPGPASRNHLLEECGRQIGVRRVVCRRARALLETSSALKADEIVINEDGRKGHTELDSSGAAKPASRRWHAALHDRHPLISSALVRI